MRLPDEYHGIDAEAPEEVVNSSLPTVKIMGRADVDDLTEAFSRPTPLPQDRHRQPENHPSGLFEERRLTPIRAGRHKRAVFRAVMAALAGQPVEPSGAGQSLSRLKKQLDSDHSKPAGIRDRP